MVTATRCIDLTEITRNEKREIWIKRQGETLGHLALITGVSTATLSRHLRNETMPVKLHECLVSYGVPAELLPMPLDQKPGSKSRIQCAPEPSVSMAMA
jgi:hypothetical protein